MLHTLALTAKDYLKLRPFEVQQTLEALASFWARVATRAKKLDDYEEYFGEEV